MTWKREKSRGRRGREARGASAPVPVSGEREEDWAKRVSPEHPPWAPVAERQEMGA